MVRPCIDCGTLTERTRCAEHERIQQRARRARRPDYTHAERQRRADVVEQYRAQHGDWCPGWGVPAHETSDLTADHVTPVAAGGREAGDLGGLCRACNGRKGNRVDHDGQAPPGLKSL